MTEEAKRGPGRPPKAAVVEGQDRTEAEKAAAQAETDANTSPAPIATVLCRVLRDYWPAEDERVRAGTIVDLPVSEALDGIEEGRMERVK
jgi:hypothetical protein